MRHNKAGFKLKRDVSARRALVAGGTGAVGLALAFFDADKFLDVVTVMPGKGSRSKAFEDPPYKKDFVAPRLRFFKGMGNGQVQHAVQQDGTKLVRPASGLAYDVTTTYIVVDEQPLEVKATPFCAATELPTVFTLNTGAESNTVSVVQDLGNLKMKPAVEAVNVQAGEPKVQLVVPGAAGVLVATPNTTLPALATCTSLVTELLPEGITNPLPVAPPVVPSRRRYLKPRDARYSSITSSRRVMVPNQSRVNGVSGRHTNATVPTNRRHSCCRAGHPTPPSISGYPTTHAAASVSSRRRSACPSR